MNIGPGQIHRGDNGVTVGAYFVTCSRRTTRESWKQTHRAMRIMTRHFQKLFTETMLYGRGELNADKMLDEICNPPLWVVP